MKRRDYGNVEREPRVSGSPEFFATRPENVNQSPLDFYIIAHLLMGEIAYLFFYYICGFAAIWSFCASIVFGIAWEPFENFVVYRIGAKFDNRRDSAVNIVFDIVFVTVGGVIAYFVTNLLVLFILIVVEVGMFALFFVLMYGQRKFGL